MPGREKRTRVAVNGEVHLAFQRGWLVRRLRIPSLCHPAPRGGIVQRRRCMDDCCRRLRVHVRLATWALGQRSPEGRHPRLAPCLDRWPKLYMLTSRSPLLML